MTAVDHAGAAGAPGSGDGGQLSVRNIDFSYGQLQVLFDVSLDVRDGEALALLGTNGAGKSTLLRVIAGLEQPAAGRVTWNGRDLAAVPVHQRGFGLMFQDFVLFPHRDVAANVAFGPRLRGDPPARVTARVAEVLGMVGLGGYERRRVTELSGGEQQRVALARALAPAPPLLMLDEPLGALDRSLRQRLLAELSQLFEQLGLTILYVTHDQEEALAVGDRVALLRAGSLETVMPPEELWRSPPTEFTARFLGLTNIADAEISADGMARTPWGAVSLPADAAAEHAAARRDGARPIVRLLLRPDGFRPDPGGTVRGTVAARSFGGDRVTLTLGVAGAPPLEVRAQLDWLPQVGDELHLSVAPQAVVVLPEAARARLSE